ncbi:hypothetical protein C0995_014803 [Termitomyces sp. Mi166|nr:hypothetical protein C0995_014803 [Termitomyces sp. Mi166\
MEGFKEKGKSKVLVTDSEKTGIKRAFKSKETVESDSNKEQERVCTIKKIKCKHIEEPTGTRKGKEVVKLQVMVVPKMPACGGAFVPNFKANVPRVIAAASAPKPVPATSTAKPAEKETSVIKDPFMMRHFKLAGTEESGMLIIDQVTEVSAGKVTGTATQETLK